MASPLHQAAMERHAAVMMLLVENGADVDARSSLLGSPLHAASRFDRADAIKALLAAGADPDARDRNEFTPLLHAAIENSLTAIKLLLDGGADVNTISIAPGGSMVIGGGSAIALQLSIRFERDDIASLLLSAGACPIPPDVHSDLASLGDAKHGRELAYAICLQCHRIEEGDPDISGNNWRGPPLMGPIGRRVADVSGYNCSKELIEYGGEWTPERLYQLVLTPNLLFREPE